MTFIEAVGEPNFVAGFSLRADVYAAWQHLLGTIKEGVDPRRYELATLAAARRMRSSYCMLAHGSVLVEKYMPAEELRAVATDHRAAGLDEIDVAIMDLAEKVADDATSVTQADVDRLRELGLSDKDVLDVVIIAAARCFLTKVVDGIGAQPDAEYAAMEPALREALVIGRPIAQDGSGGEPSAAPAASGR
jgi:uncharacterized peroxidase-related enzyme